jgi:hypothetical protein
MSLLLEAGKASVKSISSQLRAARKLTTEELRRLVTADKRWTERCGKKFAMRSDDKQQRKYLLGVYQCWLQDAAPNMRKLTAQHKTLVAQRKRTLSSGTASFAVPPPPSIPKP